MVITRIYHNRSIHECMGMHDIIKTGFSKAWNQMPIGAFTQVSVGSIEPDKTPFLILFHLFQSMHIAFMRTKAAATLRHFPYFIARRLLSFPPCRWRPYRQLFSFILKHLHFLLKCWVAHGLWTSPRSVNVASAHGNWPVAVRCTNKVHHALPMIESMPFIGTKTYFKPSDTRIYSFRNACDFRNPYM